MLIHISVKVKRKKKKGQIHTDEIEQKPLPAMKVEGGVMVGNATKPAKKNNIITAVIAISLQKGVQCPLLVPLLPCW